MKTGDIIKKVKNIAEPITKSLSLDLWNVEFSRAGHEWILAVTLDKENDNITVEDCVNVHNQISPLLDKYDFIPESYSLEISSAGINRELKTDEHILRYTEKPVRVKLYLKNEFLKTKELKGTLLSFNDNILKIKVTVNKNNENKESKDNDREENTTKIFEYEKKAIARIYADDEINV